ncbi:hypothetical protein MKW92_025867 [Papaver armeniacum]|nr:hypothetical protein MKW92_025867 [Papaver armeniacum]
MGAGSRKFILLGLLFAVFFSSLLRSWLSRTCLKKHVMSEEQVLKKSSDGSSIKKKCLGNGGIEYDIKHAGNEVEAELNKDGDEVEVEYAGKEVEVELNKTGAIVEIEIDGKKFEIQVKG